MANYVYYILIMYSLPIIFLLPIGVIIILELKITAKYTNTKILISGAWHLPNHDLNLK